MKKKKHAIKSEQKHTARSYAEVTVHAHVICPRIIFVKIALLNKKKLPGTHE
jgi:hypothetical protein